MRFKTDGIIIHKRIFGENGLIIKCITEERGIVAGFVSIRNKKISSWINVGNLIQISYYGKEDSLGKIVPEIKKAFTNIILTDRIKLQFTITIADFALMVFGNETINTDESEGFNIIKDFYNYLSDNKIDFSALGNFLITLKKIITVAGYGFNLDSCVVTNDTNIDNLKFLSPKSGCAVSEEGAGDYKKLLFVLPKFFITEETKDLVDKTDIENTIKIISRFILKTKKMNRSFEKNWLKTIELIEKNIAI